MLGELKMRDRSFLSIYILVSITSMFLSFILALLKLTGKVAISWWAVTAPIWGVILLFTAIISFVLGVICIKNCFYNKKNRWITKDINV